VIITNTMGSVTSAVATLTVYFTPQITTQPQSQTVNAGSNVVFSVVASANPPAAYQWRFNGTNLSGATKTSYTRTNAQYGKARQHCRRNALRPGREQCPTGRPGRIHSQRQQLLRQRHQFALDPRPGHDSGHPDPAAEPDQQLWHPGFLQCRRHRQRPHLPM